ncbi:hypothetical protein QUV83_14800 [Cellulomonas cellasea]|uniref:hypothetical protein n=1 Tax=Cellulomonas cellasea TaxID=43670 RepID=UPI0025A49B02|nr:hypothetical protein [Cellulomonas cellasea]MDM8086041.1 hypothetical protein [Cellulomonas cellasea]
MVMRPRWAWELDDVDGRALDRPISPVFTTQFDAEQWIGEQWRTLAQQGVHSARLLHDGHQVTPTLVLRIP